MADLPHQLHIQPRFGAKSRALIVDGHATARSILASQLRGLGVGQVLHCGNAIDARKHMETLGFDVLLCEHKLEGGTLSQALIDDLRRTGLLSLSTVVIMLSSEASYRVVAEVAESALDGFVIKPYTAGKLEDRLVGAFLRKDALREIFDAIEAERYAAGLALCEARYQARGPYWTHAARVGAELALRLNQVPLASAMYAAVLADKAVPWAKLGLARVLDAAGQGGDEVSTIQNLLSDEPSYADAYDVMGRIFADRGDFAGAINAFRQAAGITPFSVVRAQKYGILAYYAGDPVQALPALERAASLGADSPAFDHQTLLLLAMAHYKSGDAQDLKACRVRLDSAVGKLGSNAVVDARGERLLRLGQMARAHEKQTPGRPKCFSSPLGGRTPHGGGLGGAHEKQTPGRPKCFSSPSGGRTPQSGGLGGALYALQDRDRVALHAGLAQVAAGLHMPGFDMEAASNLLSLIATSDAAGLALDQAVHWVRDAGLRFCVSKQVTEVLVKACESAPNHGALVRAAHAEIGELSRTALSEGLAGDHRRAVEQLLNAVERTRNGKLLDLAGATLERHRERITDAEPLALRCTELRQRCGLNSRTPLLSDEGDRPAGGMALGLRRQTAPVRAISA